jgi:hypothetical protein
MFMATLKPMPDTNPVRNESKTQQIQLPPTISPSFEKRRLAQPDYLSYRTPEPHNGFATVCVTMTQLWNG